jgi:hypothetical protein
MMQNAGVETAKLVRVHHLRWELNICISKVLTLCATSAHAAQRSLIVWVFLNPAESNPAQRCARRLKPASGLDSLHYADRVP